MKLCGLWTIFYGEELLEGSVKQIYKELDHIIFIYQEVSNYGQRTNSRDFIKQIARKYNAEVITFYPDLSKDSHTNQKLKLIQGLKATDCTHYIYLATDEYFDTWEFIKAKDKAQNYDTTVVQMYNYFMSPEYQLNPIMDHVSPLIQRIPNNIRFDTRQYPDKIDPSRCVSPVGSYYKFDESEIVKHHYTWVRKDIKKKLTNHAGLRTNHDYKRIIENVLSWSYGDEMPFFKDKTIKKVEDKFNILHYVN